MNEIDTIARINKIFPRDKSQINKVFESDAEILKLKDFNLHVNIDEFSNEDMLRDDDPYTLGWNLSLGSISDILASGGTPLYYGHAMIKGYDWDDTYIDQFSLGIADVLKKSGIAFIGGDFGQSKNWRYTAVVLGQGDHPPLLRKGACDGDSIYITGKIGGGNFDAGLLLTKDNGYCQHLLKTHKNRFYLRHNEASIIRQFATSCIDTSDGVFNGLNTITQLNKVGYEIRDLPFLEEGIILSEKLSFPKINLFLGESGEYELLFTVNQAKEKELILKAEQKGVQFFRLGSVAKSAENRRILHEDGRTYDLTDLNVRARDFKSPQEYLAAMMKHLYQHA